MKIFWGMYVVAFVPFVISAFEIYDRSQSANKSFDGILSFIVFLDGNMEFVAYYKYILCIVTGTLLIYELGNWFFKLILGRVDKL
jgi:hypothetical protein